MLADARHDGPVPPEVAARLDEVLAGLHARRRRPRPPTPPDAGDRGRRRPAAEPQRPATVVPLRRRAARLSRYVLAAAAVLVIGYGTAQVVGGTLGSGGESDSAGSSSDAGRRQQGRERRRLRRAPPPRPRTPRRPPRSQSSASRASSRSSRARLDEDLYALDSTAEKDATALRSARRLSGACGPRTPVPGSRTLAAAYDGRPTLVVYLPPEGGSQQVDLYLCDTEKPRQAFRSVTLPTGE